jgi:four helix bundle protein
MLDKFDAFQLAKQYYWICKQLKIPRFLQDQLLRASSSIGLNIAEGSGKKTPLDQQRFYSIALGSLRECQAIIELEQIENAEVKTIGNRLGAILYVLSKKSLPTNGTVTETETATVTDNRKVTKH